MNQHKIAVAALTPEQSERANTLAMRLALPVIDPLHTEQYDYLLVLTKDYLGIQKTSNKKMKPFYIDFLSGKLRYRSQQAGLRKELLARAMGTSPRDNPRIIDATAGLGRDSFILASLGFNITLIERSLVLHALLADAMERARKDADVAPVIERMQLYQANAITWLPAAPKPQLIYLDPMFPERQKSASVKKEMVILQELLGSDLDSTLLFNTAISCATQRVVVKRPRLAANISERAPNFSLLGKSSRFDVYLT